MDWADLPSELLIIIAENLPNFTDHVRFRSVCSHWRSSFPSQYSLQCLPPQLPWLALPSPGNFTSLYALSEDRVYSTPPPVVPENTNLYGSASGWLLSLTSQNARIAASLINPFNGASINLPSPDPGSALSYAGSDPVVWDRSDSMVVAACSTRCGVFCCRLGGAAWAPIRYVEQIMVSGITFCEGHFYMHQPDYNNTIIIFDTAIYEAEQELLGPEPPSPLDAQFFVSSGELLLLVKSNWMYLIPDNDLQFYKVLRLGLNPTTSKWVEINDIGDRALFVDNLRCFSVQVGDNSVLRRNCIYTAHSRSCGGSSDQSTTYSISVFDLASSSCERLEGALSKFHAASSGGAALLPSWILPSVS